MTSLDITLLESLGTDITTDQILAGHRCRTNIAVTDITVGAFGERYVTGKPDWLNAVCQTQKGTGKHVDFDTIVSFGSGHDLCVKVRDKNSQRVQGKPVRTLSMTMGLFLSEGSNKPSMLDPRDNFFQAIHSNPHSPTLQLTICPSKPWNTKRPRSEDPSSTIVLFVDDYQLLNVIDDTEEALAAAMKGDYSSYKKKRQKKDPHAPAGKNTSYTFFMSAYRPTVKAANPDASFADISKLVGLAWKNLDPVEKAKYEAMAEQDKVRYQKEMADYDPKNPPIKPDEDIVPKKKRKARDPNAPIAARNRYVLFCAETRSKLRAENPDLTGEDISAKLNSMYQSLPREQIERYDLLAEEDQVRYSRELKEYEETGQFTPVTINEETLPPPMTDVTEESKDDAEESKDDAEEKDDENSSKEASVPPKKKGRKKKKAVSKFV